MLTIVLISSYKDVFFHLCKTLLASSSKIPLEGAQAYVPKLFGVMKKFVKGFRKAVENMEQNFIETICDYIREDYANVSFDTFHELSHSSSKAVRARLGATFLEVLKSYLETQTTVSSEKLGVLFDDYFSKDISDPLEPFAKWISLYRRRETTYQQIIDFMFFPLDCPKYTKNFEAKLVAEGKDSDVFKKFWDVLLDVRRISHSIFFLIPFFLRPT